MLRTLLASALLLTSPAAAGVPNGKPVFGLTKRLVQEKRWQGRSVQSLYPPAHAVETLRTMLEQARSLETDLDAPFPAKIEEFLSALESGLEEKPKDFIRTVNRLAEGEVLRADDLTKDKSLSEYLSLWKLDENETALYQAVRRAVGLVRKRTGDHLSGAVERQKEGMRKIKVLETYDLGEINAGLKKGPPTVDLDVHIAEGSGVTWPIMRREVHLARKVFGAHGVQVKVRLARKIRLPKSWMGLKMLLPGDYRFSRRHNDPYWNIARTHTQLTRKSKRIFSKIIGNAPGVNRRIQIITLRMGIYPFGEKGKDGRYAVTEHKVRGFSFPGYIHEGRMPKPLRGVIGLFPFRHAKKHLSPAFAVRSLAHEMGHKLLNVSHEGTGYSPKFASYKGGAVDIMLYGFGLTIPSGREGRWQAERLLKSPYLYRETPSGRRYNPDYKNEGGYDDPIYEGFLIRAKN